MQPGDVPATYADVEDLAREIGFRPGDDDRRWNCTFCKMVP